VKTCLYIFLATVIVAGAVLMAGCTPEPVTTTVTQTTTATTTLPPETITVTETITATETVTTTISTSSQPAAYSVLDIIVPEPAPLGEPFTISVVVVNTGGSQGSFDLTIVITDVKNPAIVEWYTMSVTLDAGETREVSFSAVTLTGGDYTVEAGGVTKPLTVT
jgi:hypothetical protein